MHYDYLAVTEMSGDEVIQEQVDLNYQRYYWAAEYYRGKDAVELDFLST